MTLRVAQLPFLGCCRTLRIVCGFYEVVKCFCAAPMLKKKPAIWRVYRAAFCFIFVFLYWIASNWISKNGSAIFVVYRIPFSVVVWKIFIEI